MKLRYIKLFEAFLSEADDAEEFPYDYTEEYGKFYKRKKGEKNWVEISKSEFSGHVSEKKKKKEEEEEEDPGTVLSNTTGIIATAEVSEGGKWEKFSVIDKWDDKTVDKMYGFYLDELTNAKREEEEKKKLTTAQKREVLKKQEVAFKKSFEGLSEAENKGKGWTHSQFKKQFKLKEFPEWFASTNKKYSYLKFFELNGKYYQANNYGTPGYVEEITVDKIPADLKKKLVWTKEEYIKAIRDSLEDYASQGGRITKTLIRDSIKEFGVEANIKNEVQTELEDILL